MERADPFLMFPEQVWQIIVEKLENSTNILNLLAAYPELDSSIPGNKKWRLLYIQIIQNIHPWLNRTDFLTCRLVSTRWCHDVDHYLDDHPKLTQTTPNQNTALSCEFCDPGSGCGEHFISRYQGKSLYEFRKADMIRSFCLDMSPNAKLGRNPFLGRSVILSYNNDGRPDTDPRSYWNEALNFLQLFGEHIWHICFTFLYSSGDGNPMFFNFVRDCLEHVPNLESLKIVLTPKRPFKRYINAFIVPNELFPPLTSLESLKFVGNESPPGIMHILIRCYSNSHITTLSVALPHWKVEYGGLFHSVGKLQIYGVTSKEGIKGLLYGLEMPKLTKIQIQFSELTEESEVLGAVRNVIGSLERFPLVTDLVLSSSALSDHQGFRGRLNLSQSKDTIPSLKSLEIWNGLLENNFNWLGCLPCLEKVTIVIGRDLDLDIQEEISGQKIYESDIWEILLNLKSVTIRTSVESRRNILEQKPMQIHNYHRARYEHLRRLRPPSASTLKLSAFFRHVHSISEWMGTLIRNFATE